MIRFQCPTCDKGLKVPEEQAGKRGRCPNCQGAIAVPLSDTLDDFPIPFTGLRLKEEPISTISAPIHVPTEHPSLLESPPEEVKGQRKYSTVLDIFLYPSSLPGLVNLFIFWCVIPVLGLIPYVIPILRVRFLGLLVGGIGPAYLIYYLTDCVRDSADGGTRAPENMGNTPDLWTVVSQMLYVMCTILLMTIGPVGYYFWRGADTIFWVLTGSAIFLLPMALLSTILLDSINIFFPWLWLSSIISTLIPYLGLSLLSLASLGATLGLFRVIPAPQRQIMSYLLLGPIIYGMMIGAHILGRFFFCNEKQLNWEA